MLWKVRNSPASVPLSASGPKVNGSKFYGTSFQFLCKLADKQTNQQTDTCENITALQDYINAWIIFESTMNCK